MLPRLLCLFIFLCLAPFLRAAGSPVVAILANSDDPDSLKVARHYAEARRIPAENIIALPMPLAEQITWQEFVLTLHRPLQAELVKRGWIDGIMMDLEDEVGRRKVAVNDLVLSALVVCRGVPLKIANDKELGAKSAPDKATPSNFQTNECAVDSELALLALPDQPINGFVPNPVFGSTRRGEAARLNIIPVGRLDGPTVEDAMALVDHALQAEREGLVGRAYIDLGGRYPQGDTWLREAADELAKIGFAADIDTDKATLSPAARFDMPAWYFGWYDGSVSGPMRDRDFRFAPGAVAFHIHSFSASSMRNGNGPWAPALVARGVTLTVGNVFEPYLQFTHQPQRLVRALISGAPAGEAALQSLNALSWQAILIGDPLYQPFKVSFDEQWSRLASWPLNQLPYLYLRRIALLDAEGNAVQAKSLAWSALRKSASMPVVLGLARRQIENKDKRGARQTLAIIGGVSRWRTADAPMIAAGARLLVEAEDASTAVDWYRRLFNDSKLDTSVRKALLVEAQDAARKAMDFTQAGRWETELQGK